MLAMGDALAVVVAERRGFKEKDFALLHPGGQLGRRLLLRVRDIMRVGPRHPVVRETAKVRDVLLAITRGRAGCASVVDGRGRLAGIFTDGDLRRHLDRTPQLVERRVAEVMTRGPKVIEADCLAAQALGILREYRIDELVVVDRQRRPVGLLDVQDLLNAGF
jgi:arabinose-5-phosphate isomerase